MGAEELTARLETILATNAETFRQQAIEEAEVIVETLEDGAFDNPQAIVGFEYEFYAVDRDTAALKRVPRRLLELMGFEKELGLHNAEMTTSPQPLNRDGLRAQEAEIRAQFRAARDVANAEGMELISDGMWTIPPAGERATAYLTDCINRPLGDTKRTVTLATNMSDTARYHAMANTDRADAAGKLLDCPHVSMEAETVMPESLITSIQPHYQVPHAPDLPTYFTYALRIAGPMLALGCNAPFFPADCYDDDVTAAEIVQDAWMEHRISVFETVLNDPTTGPGKVRFPRDIESVEEAVKRIATDDTLVPMPVERGDRFDDQFAHFRRKHGTYWRWVRPVFDGPTRSAANARIEFRPIPAQPTIRDSVAFLAMFAGLMESLPSLEHPVYDLDWEHARSNFYNAMRDGLETDLEWITNDGQPTTALETIAEDLFAHAADGLSSRGLSSDEIASYLSPLEQRVRQRRTPARWKHALVTSEVENGASLSDALDTMQRRYVECQRETMLEGSFSDWNNPLSTV